MIWGNNCGREYQKNYDSEKGPSLKYPREDSCKGWGTVKETEWWEVGSVKSDSEETLQRFEGY